MCGCLPGAQDLNDLRYEIRRRASSSQLKTSCIEISSSEPQRVKPAAVDFRGGLLQAKCKCHRGVCWYRKPRCKLRLQRAPNACIGLGKVSAEFFGFPGKNACAPSRPPMPAPTLAQPLTSPGCRLSSLKRKGPRAPLSGGPHLGGPGVDTQHTRRR